MYKKLKSKQNETFRSQRKIHSDLGNLCYQLGHQPYDGAGTCFASGNRKTLWFLFKQITKERRKREIEPVVAFLEELKNIEDHDSEEAKEFIKLMDDFSNVTSKINNIMDLAIKSDDHWLVGKITNLLK